MNKQNLTIIGMGNFGRFMTGHLIPHFNITICDPFQNLHNFSNCHNLQIVQYEEISQSDIVILAVPFKAMHDVITSIIPYLKSDCLVMDVASVKVKPLAIMLGMLPNTINIIGLHPLFGPQSGINGIQGLNVAVVQGRGDKESSVIDFLENILSLKIYQCTAEEHDIQMAYVQGLTHLIAKAFNMMNIPDIIQTTKTYDLLNQMVGLIKNDSDDLFQSILMDNPYVENIRDDFFQSMRDLENRLKAN